MKLYFGNNKLFFKKQLGYEIIKLEEDETEAIDDTDNRDFEDRDIEKMTLNEIRKQDERKWREITDEVFEKYKGTDGYYECPKSHYRSKRRLYFDVDHIKPISKGGLTRLDNLRILKRDINRGAGNRGAITDLKGQTIRKMINGEIISLAYGDTSNKFRFEVERKYITAIGLNTVVVGKIISGSIKDGDTVRINEKSANVLTVSDPQGFNENVAYDVEYDTTRIILKGIKEEEIAVGDIIYN